MKLENKRSKRLVSQSSDRDEYPSETRFTQVFASLVHVSENVNNIFDRNQCSALTEPSQTYNEIKEISQRLAEQNNIRMTHIEEQLNNKFEEALEEIIAKKNIDLKTDKEDAQNNRPGPSGSKNKLFRRKHVSNIAIDKDKSQDNHSESSEMNEPRQKSTPFGVVNVTLDETIIINGNDRKPIITR